MRSSNNAVPDKLNKKNYRSYSKKSDFEIKENNKVQQNKKPNNNDNNNNININNNQMNNKIILPIVRIGEQKINNNKSYDYNNNNNNNNNNINSNAVVNNVNIKKMNENKKNAQPLVYSGSQKLIINNANKKILNVNVNGINPNGVRKVLHKNMSSEFPSLNIINQKNKNLNHLNEIYKIYSPYFDKPQMNSNKLKVLNNNNYYLKNIQRYYKMDKQPLGKNYNGYHINLNRIGSGRKVYPNRKLSPIKKNIINIY